MKQQESTARPAEAAILEQRDRILASRPFANSKRMRDFLNYLIRESLGDKPPRLKEFSIGVAVFGRDESFDPRIDAVVRVEAIRLRTKLREYYSEAGRHDPVEITIPKGGYIPHFESVDGESDNDREPVSGNAWPIARSRGLMWASATIAIVTSLWLSVGPGATPVDPARDPSTHSIAILPIRDWNGSDGDYFSEALTDVLIAKLSRYDALRVRSIGSAMQYRESDLPPSTIAARLDVESIVKATVYRDSGEIRITASLIDASANRVSWSQSFTRPLDMFMALQEEIAGAITRQLLGELIPEEPVPAHDVNPLAYDAFLKGVHWRNRLTEQGFRQGMMFFRQAIQLQPDFADAYAAMAACHCRLAGHGIEVIQPDIALPQAKSLAARALELDASQADALAIMGIISFKYDWDRKAAIDYLNRALAQSPSLFEAHLWLSQIFEGSGNHELAVARARAARGVNPLSHVANLNLGWQLYQAGESIEAEIEFDKLVQFDPDFWGGHWGRGHVLRQRKMYDEAISAFSSAVDLGGGHTMSLASLGYTYAIAGEREMALGILDNLVDIAETTYVSPMDFAVVHAGLGDRDEVFRWLEKAFEVRARSMAWLTAKDEFALFRSDPRFTSLVASVGIAGGWSQPVSD